MGVSPTHAKADRHVLAKKVDVGTRVVARPSAVHTPENPDAQAFALGRGRTSDIPRVGDAFATLVDQGQQSQAGSA